jgi:hypothetical protein
MSIVWCRQTNRRFKDRITLRLSSQSFPIGILSTLNNNVYGRSALNGSLSIAGKLSKIVVG